MIYANTQPVQNSLEQYIPLPLDSIWKAGQAIQERGDKAQAAADQVQMGLASMEANLPGHRQFVNQFANDYKTKASQLLDKYSNNTSDPGFIRESRQLGLQFAADPRLRTIQLANQEYQQKQKLKTQLDAEGKKYIDTNPYATGIDSNGVLNANVGDLRGTNFDENIDKSFKNLENATENVNGTITNKRNLLGKFKTYLDSWDSNPDIQQGLQYYKQQGLSDDAAKSAVLSHLNSGLAYGKDVKDHFYEEQAERMREFNINRADKFALQKARLDAKNNSTIVQPGEIASTNSPILTQNINKPKLDSIDTVLSNLNENGGIRKTNVWDTVDDTPENRRKYPNAEVTDKFSDIHGLGPGAVPQRIGTQLRLPPKGNYSQLDSRLVDEARDFLGDKAKNSSGNWLSDKSVLTRYKSAISGSQADSFNYSLPINDKYNKALTEHYFGKGLAALGNDYVVVTKDGTYKAGTPDAEKALANIDNVKMMGVNAAPYNTYINGTIAAQGTTKSKTAGVNGPRENVMIIKPMDSNMAAQYSNSNKASTALMSSFTNNELINNPEAKSLRIVNNRTGVEYVPQKGLTSNSKLGVTYYPLINGKLDKSNPININQMEQAEHSAFFSRLGQSINTKAENQNYSDYNDDE